MHKSVAEQISHLIIINEEPEKWEESVGSYLVTPVDQNEERVKQVIEIAAEHQISEYLASILLISKNNVS